MRQRSIFCKCGMSVTGISADPALAFYQKLKKIMREGHEGEGHGETTAAECAKARRKSWREERGAE